MPEFSVVMPTHNREHLIARAIQSCLLQQAADFEVIVVDDGSTDRSAKAVESLRDPRIRLIRHASNRGHGAARNTGVEAASGEWIVMLDSDDEFLPGALARMSEIARRHGSGIERLGFMYRRDDGLTSPLPSLHHEVLDFAGYLRWLESRTFFDFLQCTRRFTFERVRWREWGLAGSMLYQMDFPRHYRTLFNAEVLGLVHADAVNRLSWKRRTHRVTFRAGTELGEEMDLILVRYGKALQEFAPKTLQRFLRVRASYYFMTGAIGQGVRQSLRCLRKSPFCFETWLQLAAGLTGPQTFARIRSLRPPPT